jgi:hypothetical protein
MLRWPLSYYEIDPLTQLCSAIHSAEGQKIATQHVVSNSDNFSNFASDEYADFIELLIYVFMRWFLGWCIFQFVLI